MVAHLQLVRRHMASRMDVPQVRLQPAPCCKMSRPRPSVHNTGRAGWLSTFPGRSEDGRVCATSTSCHATRNNFGFQQPPVSTNTSRTWNPSARAHHGRNLGHTPGRTQWLERRVATSAPSSPDPLQHITRAAGQHLAAPEANLPAQLQRRGNQLPNNALIHLAWAVDLFMQPSGYI